MCLIKGHYRFKNDLVKKKLIVSVLFLCTRWSNVILTYKLEKEEHGFWVKGGRTMTILSLPSVILEIKKNLKDLLNLNIYNSINTIRIIGKQLICLTFSYRYSNLVLKVTAFCNQLPLWATCGLFNNFKDIALCHNFYMCDILYLYVQLFTIRLWMLIPSAQWVRHYMCISISLWGFIL